MRGGRNWLGNARSVALVLAGAVLFLFAAPSAQAQEWSFGIADHDISINGNSRESGVNVEAEIVGDPIEHLKVIGHPRPYAMASVNTEGDTSYAAAGLYWRVRLSKSWSLQPGFGVAVHNGKLHNPFPSDDPRASDFSRSHSLLGARTLFRDTLAVEHQIDDRHEIALVYEHLSNGGSLFGHRDNEGLNEIGVRYSVRFS